MFFIYACFKELLYILCISEACGINSVQTSLVEVCDARYHMQTNKKNPAKLKRVACHINGNHVKSMPPDSQRDVHQNKQILGSLPLPFIAGTAGDNKWLKDLIGHWDS